MIISTWKNLSSTHQIEAPPIGFKWALEKWIQSGTLEDNVVEAILLDIHYKYDRTKNIATLLDNTKKSIWILPIHGKISKGSKFFNNIIERSHVNVCLFVSL
jgi:hypothetical protein